MTPSVRATGNVELRFEPHDTIENAWVPVLSSDNGAVVESVSLSGSYSLQGKEPSRIWKQGYQSWWWSGVADLVEPVMDEHGLPVIGGDGGGTSATEETPWSSWWNGLVGKSDGDSLLLGGLSSTTTRVWSAFSDDQAWFVWGVEATRCILLREKNVDSIPFGLVATLPLLPCSVAMLKRQHRMLALASAQTGRRLAGPPGIHVTNTSTKRFFEAIWLSPKLSLKMSVWPRQSFNR